MRRISFRSILAILLLVVADATLHAQVVTITSLPFNSGADDFAGVTTGNGRTIYFTSRRDGDQKIFASERAGGESWSTASLQQEASMGDENGTSAITPDGQLMIFSSLDNPVDGMGRTDLYIAERVNGRWSNVRNLGPEVNSSYWDSHPSLSTDGRTLYFASDRPGGRGKVDIWISRNVNGIWSAPVNAGAEVNTPDDDMAPSIAPDGRTFYFASNRSGGQGGFDLYTAKVSGSGFTGLRAMAAPINSSADEYFYFAQNTSDRAFFSSNRAGGAGGIDIYTASPNPYPSDAVVSVSGTVSDALSNAPLGASITITDLKTNQQVARLRSDDIDGGYFVTLQAGRTYSITAQKGGYLFYSDRYDVPAGAPGAEYRKDIKLSPIKGGSIRLLVFFEFAKADLTPESRAELDRLKEFMNDNVDARIALEGHTDDVGTDAANDELSKRRADAVKGYLVESGIGGARIETRGFGKRQPLVPGTSEEARANNRRVEMKIVQ